VTNRPANSRRLLLVHAHPMTSNRHGRDHGEVRSPDGAHVTL